MLAEKFFADSECFVSRSSARVEHIFSELYAVPAGIRRGYFKVKVLELLLFLSALDVAHEKHGYTAAQVRLARAARDALLASTEDDVIESPRLHRNSVRRPRSSPRAFAVCTA